MNLCPACAFPLLPNAASCSACGFLLGSTPAGAPKFPVATLACPGCDALQRPNALICAMCGESLAARPLRAGEALDGGHFVVRAPLSQGGMGALYLASDQRAFGRQVVIKALGEEQLFDKAGEQLRTEGWLLSQLRQPNMPHMLGYFQHGAQHFVAMEFIDGPNLHQQLTEYEQDGTPKQAGRPFASADVLRWGAAIARTLEYLHSQKPYAIIHQDIKPANLVLENASGMVKLIDFGNAALYQPGQRTPDAFGTPGYAPREQYRGESEPRSDVYALAATMYHLASDDDPAIHPFRFPQLAQLGPFGDILAAALDNDPAVRPTAAVFRAQIEALQAVQATPQLHAPDGSIIEDETDLVFWCEANWQAACAWIQGDMATQVHRWRGAKRMAQLRTLIDTNPTADAALDGWLAAIDPLDFAAAAPALVVSSRTLVVPGKGATFTIANTGRRFIQAKLLGPAWLQCSSDIVMISPGQHMQVRLSRSAPKARAAALQIVVGGVVLATCQVRPIA